MREREIVDLLLQKDERGMDALLIYYGPLMKYIIAPILQNEHDREDCLSEATMLVWNKIDQFNAARGSWNAWLTTVTRNHALNYKRQTAARDSTGEIPENTPSPEPTPEEQVILKEQQEAVKRALARLTTKDKTLFYRKYYYLQSTAQIAAEMGLTERAVEGKLYRIKKKLRKQLGGEWDA